MQYIYINTKQNSFHLNSIFLFSKTYFVNKKIIVYRLYLLDASIDGTIWSFWKKGRDPDPINPPFDAHLF